MHKFYIAECFGDECYLVLVSETKAKLIVKANGLPHFDHMHFGTVEADRISSAIRMVLAGNYVRNDYLIGLDRPSAIG